MNGKYSEEKSQSTPGTSPPFAHHWTKKLHMLCDEN
jgi:hypothetical protein